MICICVGSDVQTYATTPNYMRQHSTGCANGYHMYNPTMLGVVGQQCYICLYGALDCINILYLLLAHLGILVNMLIKRLIAVIGGSSPVLWYFLGILSHVSAQCRMCQQKAAKKLSKFNPKLS